jgi:hypothetical protein
VSFTFGMSETTDSASAERTYLLPWSASVLLSILACGWGLAFLLRCGFGFVISVPVGTFTMLPAGVITVVIAPSTRTTVTVPPACQRYLSPRAGVAQPTGFSEPPGCVSGVFIRQWPAVAEPARSP